MKKFLKVIGILAGLIVLKVGIQAWFFIGGTLCIFMAIAGLFIPAVMNIETKHKETRPAYI